MVFKVIETKKSEMQTEQFTFNALSEHNGIELHLTGYQIEATGSKTRKWRSYGDDGTFLRRESISIPQDIIDSVKAKVISSISTIIR